MKPIRYLLIIPVSLIFSYGAVHAQVAETVLSIPSIGVYASIGEVLLSEELETWDVSGLVMTVGHLQYTPWFGETGNVILAGHSETARGVPEIFFNLNAVQVGDEIMVQSGDLIYRYTVTQVTSVAMDDLSILKRSGTETLTMFTCDLSSYTGNNTYTRRFVVVAERSS